MLNSSVMLGNYLQQTTSADDIFRCIFILGAIKVNVFFFLAESDLKQIVNFATICKTRMDTEAKAIL